MEYVEQTDFVIYEKTTDIRIKKHIKDNNCDSLIDEFIQSYIDTKSNYFIINDGLYSYRKYSYKDYIPKNTNNFTIMHYTI